MKYTKEQIELWEQMSQQAATLSASLFSRTENLVIQDFIESGKEALVEELKEENENSL